MLESLRKIPLATWLQIIAMFAAVGLILMQVGSWKQGVEDHLINQDFHIVRQDHAMLDLTQSLEKENDKLDSLKDQLNDANKRLIGVEEWMKLDAANKLYERGKGKR
jgi:hypothetical protein